MTFKTLETTPLPQIIECFNAAFAGYFVTMPTGVDYWKQRWRGARIDYACCMGAFDGDTLAGFVLHGVDTAEDGNVAWNIGTGVIPAYRGQRLTTRIYDHALPLLSEAGIVRFGLEVITDNKPAINVYEHVGFSIVHELLCFHGSITGDSNAEIHVRQLPLNANAFAGLKRGTQYAWDNTVSAIGALSDVYRLYEVREAGDVFGHFIINPGTHYLARFDLTGTEDTVQYARLLRAVAKVSPEVRVNNVYDHQVHRLEALKACGLSVKVRQYQMEMEIDRT